MYDNVSIYEKEIRSIPLLSDDETNKLITLHKNGDKNARELLIKHNLRLVLMEANRYSKSINLPIEDLISIGSFGLIRAIDSFNSNKAKLSTIAVVSIKNAYNSYIDNMGMKKRSGSFEVSLSDPIVFNGGNDGEFALTFEETLISQKPQVDEVVAKRIKYSLLRREINKLPVYDRKVLCMYFGFNQGITYTSREISKVFGVSHQRIAQKKDEAIKKLCKPTFKRLITE